MAFGEWLTRKGRSRARLGRGRADGGQVSAHGPRRQQGVDRAAAVGLEPVLQRIDIAALARSGQGVGAF